MPYDEDAFMRLDSASEESDNNVTNEEESVYDDESSGSTADGDDDDTDNKIMEYLLNGYALASLACPSCQTPLIKNFNDIQEENSPSLVNEKHEVGKPIKGVPFCVSCKAVVVTSNAELQIMWRNEYKYLMGVEGAVHLAIQETSGDAGDIRGAILDSSSQKSTPSQDDDDDDEVAHARIQDNNIVLKSENHHVAVSGEEEDRQQEDENSVEVKERNIDTVKNVPRDRTHIEDKTNVETKPKEEIDIGMIDYQKR
jgi:hypothetical protein